MTKQEKDARERFSLGLRTRIRNLMRFSGIMISAAVGA